MNEILSDLFWSFVMTIVIAAFVYFMACMIADLFKEEIEQHRRQKKDEMGDVE